MRIEIYPYIAQGWDAKIIASTVIDLPDGTSTTKVVEQLIAVPHDKIGSAIYKMIETAKYKIKHNKKIYPPSCGSLSCVCNDAESTDVESEKVHYSSNKLKRDGIE